MSIFDISGTPSQVALVERALSRCDFEWTLLLPELQSEVGRERIPVEWADLSRWAAAVAEGKGGHAHVHEFTEDGLIVDTGHPVEARGRVLGLAWYSGKVSLDLSCEADPELAQEVFLAEVAHMVDFFYLTDEHRDRIFLAYHGNLDTEHGHDWFDVGTYGEWVGEAWMSGFTLAFSDVTPTIILGHTTTREAARRTFRRLLGARAPYFSTPRGRTFHDAHSRLFRAIEWHTIDEALEAGRRPCRTCLPL